jgi:hypothetical protein
VNTIPTIPTERTQVPRRPWLDPWSLLLAALPLAPLAIDMTGIEHYRAGLRNDAPLVLGRSAVLAMALGLLCTSVLLVRSLGLWRLRDRRAVAATALLALTLLVWPALCGVRESPDDAYLRGLAQWTRDRTDVPGLRQWIATLPTTGPWNMPRAWYLSPEGYPPQIAAMNPANVQQFAAGRGVMVEWGTLASWGTSRKLFVGPDDLSAPPNDDFQYTWIKAGPGLYAGLQKTN